jgi:hypothetical protein
MRLFVNFFQPSFKLAAKARDGAKVRKRYHPPATPCQRLLADTRTSQEVRRRLNELRATLDPVRLLREVRAAQQQLVEIADTPAAGDVAKPTPPTLEQFLSGLRTAWQEGEVRPTSAPRAKPKRLRRRPDPLATVTTELRGVVRGRALAHIARIVRAAAGRVSRRLPGRTVENTPASYKGVAT